MRWPLLSRTFAALNSIAMASNNNNGVVTQGEKLVEFYGSGAKYYSEMMNDEMKKIAPDLTVLLKNLPTKGHIVDTCVGSGHMLEWIHNEKGTDKNWNLRGIDISPEMLKQAGLRLKDKATLSLGDMLDTSSEPNGTCAAIINTFALHHASPEQCDSVISEWARMLCPGGCLYLGVWEGDGPIDYGDHSPGFKALLHSESQVIEWITKAELDVIHSRQHMEEEMGMNSMYVIAKKKK